MLPALWPHSSDGLLRLIGTVPSNPGPYFLSTFTELNLSLDVPLRCWDTAVIHIIKLLQPSVYTIGHHTHNSRRVSILIKCRGEGIKLGGNRTLVRTWATVDIDNIILALLTLSLTTPG